MNFLAWGARGRRFKSSHPDSFFLMSYVDLAYFKKADFSRVWRMAPLKKY